MIYDRNNSLIVFELLEDFVSTTEIRKFRGNAKKMYRLLLLKTFCSAWTNDRREFQDGISQLILMLHYRDNNYTKFDEEDYNYKSNCWQDYLFERSFNCINKESDQYEVVEAHLITAIEFCRDFITEYLANKQTLYMYAQIESFWNLEELIKKNTTSTIRKILPCHWFDLSIFQYHIPILTFPDYLAYQDMINLWNDLIKKNEAYLTSNGIETRSIAHSIISSEKYTIVAAVHFVEIYLFYFYYLCKLQNTFPNNELTNRTNIRSITDKSIVEKLLMKEYLPLPVNIKKFYDDYKEILSIRDAIAHLSPFRDDHSNKSRIELSFNIGLSNVGRYLQTCYDFVLEIERSINGDLLFWTDSMEQPNFLSNKQINNLNIKV
ncbi:MAG: hypothetical protein U9Q88_00180 [Bacillota bacterium]|nr:hypothetical protein [Bacillota bacterium]